MLRTKEDVDIHANSVLRNARHESEKRVKCYYISQLYLKVKDFESVKDYATNYLNYKSDSAPGYKILGQAYEGLKEFDKAIESYENSFKNDPSQHNLALKVCELYSLSSVTFDPEKVKMWLKTSEKYFPHHPVLATLKEKFVGFEGNSITEELEPYLLESLDAEPSNFKLRIKLYRYFCNTNRADEALKNATNFYLQKESFIKNELCWYLCFDYICESYAVSHPDKITFEFYMLWLHVLDRLCILTLSDVLCDGSEIQTTVKKFDTLLMNVSQNKDILQHDVNNYIDHMSSQLVFILSLLYIRLSSEELNGRSDSKVGLCSLLYVAYHNHLTWKEECPSLPFLASLHSSIPLKHFLITSSYHETNDALLQIGYTLLGMIGGDDTKEKQLMDKVAYFSGGPWKKILYEKLLKVSAEESSTHSFFLSSKRFDKIPRKFIKKKDLTGHKLVYSFETLHYNSLRHLVWLGVHSLSKTVLAPWLSKANASSMALDASLSTSLANLTPSNFRFTTYKNITFSANTLSSCLPHTLNLLDLETFLCASILSAYVSLNECKANMTVDPDNYLWTLPANVTDHLCSEKQSNWWRLATNMAANGSVWKGDLNDWKQSSWKGRIQEGLEVVRGEGLPLNLCLFLARFFSARSELERIESKKDSIIKRAVHLYELSNVALMEYSNRTKRVVILSDFFNLPQPTFSDSELAKLIHECKYYIGSYHLSCKSYEKALNYFKNIPSVESLIKQAGIYEKMASDCIDRVIGEDVTSEMRVKQAVLAGKARDLLLQAKELAKEEEQDQELQQVIKTRLYQVERLLARIEHPTNTPFPFVEPDAVEPPALLNVSDGSSTANSSPLLMDKSNKLTKVLEAAALRKPRMERKMNSERAELINLQASNSNIEMQRVLEQTRFVLDRLEGILFEQRNQRYLIEELTNKLGKLDLEMKADFSCLKKEIKKPDLYSMLGDDYNDDLLQYRNVSSGPYGGSSRTMQSGVPNGAGPPLQQYHFSPTQLYHGIYGAGSNQGFVDGNTQVADYVRTLQQQQGDVRQVIGSGLVGMQQSPMVEQDLTQLFFNNLVPSTQSAQSHYQQPRQQPGVSMPPHVPAAQFPNLDPLTLKVPNTLENKLPVTTSFGGGTNVSSHFQFQISLPNDFRLIDQPPKATSTSSILSTSNTLNTATTISSLLKTPTSYASDGVETQQVTDVPRSKPETLLPEKVNLITGEEDEVSVFECNPQVFHFVDKSWKERGVGLLKILKNKHTNKHRIIMRRDKTFKVCVNHFMTENMKLNTYNKTENAWIWCATDYADGVLKKEVFIAKFKTSDDYNKFYEHFEIARIQESERAGANASLMNSTLSNETTDKVSASSPIVSSTQGRNKTPILSAPKLIVNKDTLPNTNKVNTSISNMSRKDQNPVVLDNPKVNPASQNSLQKEFSVLSNTLSTSNSPELKISCEPPLSTILSRTDTWECQGCYVSNPSSENSCLACSAPNPSATPSSKVSAETKESPAFNFTFGFPPVSKAETTPSQTSDFNPFTIRPGLNTFMFSKNNSNTQTLEQSSVNTEFGKTFTLGGKISNKIQNDKEIHHEVLNTKPDGQLSMLSDQPMQYCDGSGDNITKIEQNELNNDVVFVREIKVSENLRQKALSLKLPENFYNYLENPKKCPGCRGCECDDEVIAVSDLPPAAATSLMEKDFAKSEENHGSPLLVNPVSKFGSSTPVTDKSEGSHRSPLLVNAVTKLDSSTSVTTASPLSLTFTLNQQKGASSSNNMTSEPSISISGGPLFPNQTSFSDLSRKPSIFGGAPLDKSIESFSFSSCPLVNSSSTGFNFRQPVTNSLPFPKLTEGQSEVEVVKSPAESSSDSIAPNDGEKAGNVEFTFQPLNQILTSENNMTNSTSLSGPFFGNQKQTISLASTSGMSSSKPTSNSIDYIFQNVLAQQNIQGTKQGGDNGFQWPTAGSLIGNNAADSKNQVGGVNSQEVDKEGSNDSYVEGNTVETAVVPLLPEVEQITGEEDEEVLFLKPAKLYRLYKDEKTTQWKERGEGSLKVLFHPIKKVYRLLMRRDVVLNVICNHFITLDMNLEPKNKASFTWIWTAMNFVPDKNDFECETLCVRFKTEVISTEFKSCIDEVKKKLEIAESEKESSTTVNQ